jgi:hypothetical protein
MVKTVPQEFFLEVFHACRERGESTVSPEHDLSEISTRLLDCVSAPLLQQRFHFDPTA